MTAFEAAANMTSDSVTPPTARRMTRTETSSWGSLAISSSIASSDPAPVGAGHEGVANRQRPAHHEDGHDRAPAGIELRLDDGAGRRGIGIRPQLLDLSHDEDRVEQVVQPVLGPRRDVDELRVATP